MMTLRSFTVWIGALGLAGCASTPLPTADAVDLPSFMGDWYVQGHVPVGVEARGYNGIESYRRGEDGRIDTTYEFRVGSHYGRIETLRPTGYVDQSDPSGATWGMQFLWPFEAEYKIAWLAPEGDATIIARTARDYAWIMTRQPMISDARYESLVRRLAGMGYDPADVRRMPQSWPDPGEPPIRPWRGDG